MNAWESFKEGFMEGVHEVLPGEGFFHALGNVVVVVLFILGFIGSIATTFFVLGYLFL